MFQKKTKLYRYRTVYISGHFHDDIIFRVLFSRYLLHCKISNTQTLYPTLFAVRKVFLKIVKKWMLQIKKLDIFPQFRKFIDMWKKTPRIYGIYPVTNREIRFLVIFYEYLPDVYMHPTMKLFNTVHQLIFVCENFCEVRESLVFVNACISHRDLVFKCLSLVFSLWIG